MSRDTKSAPLFSEPKTAADVLSHINQLAQSHPSILQQELSLRLEAPQVNQSEEALRRFVETVDYMRENTRVLELYLNQLSQKAGEKLDFFCPNDVRCAVYYEVKAKQDAKYRESLPHAIADLERYHKPQPAPAAEDAQAVG